MKKTLVVLGAAVLALALVNGCCKNLVKGKSTPGEPVPIKLGEGPAGSAAVGGRYAGGGTNPDGSTYKCEVEVKPAGKVYQVMWYLDGNPAYEGMGILKGNTFTVGFANNAGYGVVAYTVNSDGSLDGVWAGKGANKAGSEKLSKK